ncbi:MAG TPA: hypothetical protein VLH56_16455 [Dissulfurispiraceae bacterium]|nr:hypothetical protein [Dissulfurispiraceae bacterium]
MYKKSAIILVFVVFLLGCATAGQQLTPKQQATIYMQTYNAVYDDTMRTMQNPAATPAQKQIALQKRALLTEIWPVLKIYVATVEGGAIPSAELEATLTALINQLATFATGGK